MASGRLGTADLSTSGVLVQVYGPAPTPAAPNATSVNVWFTNRDGNPRLIRCFASMSSTTGGVTAADAVGAYDKTLLGNAPYQIATLSLSTGEYIYALASWSVGTNGVSVRVDGFEGAA